MRAKGGPSARHHDPKCDASSGRSHILGVIPACLCRIDGGRCAPRAVITIMSHLFDDPQCEIFCVT